MAWRLRCALGPLLFGLRPAPRLQCDLELWFVNDGFNDFRMFGSASLGTLARTPPSGTDPFSNFYESDLLPWFVRTDAI